MLVTLFTACYIRRNFLLYDDKPAGAYNDVREGVTDAVLSAITDVMIAQVRFVIFALLLLPAADMILIAILFVVEMATSIDT